MHIGPKILALALLGLSACGRPPAQPEAPAAFTVTAPNFGESHPVDWNGNPPSSHPVHGIDISVWQGEVDWRLPGPMA